MIERNSKGQFIKGLAPWNKGVSPSEASRKKQSLRMMGRTPWNKGISPSDETRKKQSLSHMGFKPDIETRKKMSQSHMGEMTEEKHPAWKGDDVGYVALHEWVRKHKPKPELCEICNEKHPYDTANISGEYRRDINDYRWICRKCHMESDGRIFKKE